MRGVECVGIALCWIHLEHVMIWIFFNSSGKNKEEHLIIATRLAEMEKRRIGTRFLDREVRDILRDIIYLRDIFAWYYLHALRVRSSGMFRWRTPIWTNRWASRSRRKCKTAIWCENSSPTEIERHEVKLSIRSNQTFSIKNAFRKLWKLSVQ